MASIISASTTSGTALNMSADTTGVLQLATGATPTTAVTIDASQNVGIGTTSPNYNLQINGSANSYFQLTNSSTGTAITDGLVIGNDGTAANIIQRENLPLVLFTNNTERMRIDSSGNLLFNSGYGSVATAYGCRAWVNFNGTGTVAIRASGNVSSITDNNTGDYTVNFTTALVDANYSGIAGGGDAASIADNSKFVTALFTTTSMRVGIRNSTTGAAIDSSYVMVAVHR